MAVYLMEAILLFPPRGVRADAAASCCYCSSCSVSLHEIKEHSDPHCSMAGALAAHTHLTQRHPARQAHPRGTETACAAPQHAGLQELVCEPAASFKTNTSPRFFSGCLVHLLLQNLYLHNDPGQIGRQKHHLTAWNERDP